MGRRAHRLARHPKFFTPVPACCDQAGLGSLQYCFLASGETSAGEKMPCSHRDPSATRSPELCGKSLAFTIIFDRDLREDRCHRWKPSSITLELTLACQRFLSKTYKRRPDMKTRFALLACFAAISTSVVVAQTAPPPAWQQGRKADMADSKPRPACWQIDCHASLGYSGAELEAPGRFQGRNLVIRRPRWTRNGSW